VDKPIALVFVDRVQPKLCCVSGPLGKGKGERTMIPNAKLRPGPGFRAGRVALYFTQRLVVAPWLRRLVAQTIASLIRLGQSTGSWAPVGSQYAHVVRALNQQGIATLPGLMTEDKANSILQYLQGQDALLSDGRLMPTAQLPADCRMAVYPLRTLIKNFDILSLITAAPVMRLAADYLGCKPTLSGLSAYWSFPGNEPAVFTQHFHRDLDDWRFLKLFVYLTDVDHDSGPHAYVMQSHRTAAHFRARPYSQRAIDRCYGHDQVHRVLGAHGTAFMADTYGIHAGTVPARAPRLILQAQYSLLPVFAFVYEAVKGVEAQNTPNLDPYVARLLISDG
jgi:hypothetical protein